MFSLKDFFKLRFKRFCRFVFPYYGVDGFTENFKPYENHSHAEHYVTYFIHFLAFHEQRENESYTGNQRGDCGNIYSARARQRQNLSGYRRSDIRAHNYRSRLRKSHKPYVDETDEHYRRCRGTVYYRGNGRAYPHARKPVVGHFAEHFLHIVAGNEFEIRTHYSHSEKQDRYSAEHKENICYYRISHRFILVVI